MQWQMQSAQWAAMMQMENLRLQQIAAMQSAMINTMSQEIAKQGDLEPCHLTQRPEDAQEPCAPRQLVRPMEPMKIATPETLSPQSTSSLPAFSYMSPLPSPASLPSPLAHAPAKPPPGLELPTERPERDTAPVASVEEVENLKGLSIVTIAGPGDSTVTRVVWSIANPQAKLQVSCGSALVSPAFTCGMEGLRLLFSPGEGWWHEFQAKKAKKTKRRAERLPRFGALQLKLAGDLSGAPVTLVFRMGGETLSPMTVNPGHSTCLICELDKDWRREMDSTDGSLVVGVDIITAHTSD